jgi:hypothetical protein
VASIIRQALAVGSHVRPARPRVVGRLMEPWSSRGRVSRRGGHAARRRYYHELAAHGTHETHGAGPRQVLPYTSRPLFSSTWRYPFLKLPCYKWLIPRNVLTLSRNVDYCKALALGIGAAAAMKKMQKKMGRGKPKAPPPAPEGGVSAGALRRLRRRGGGGGGRRQPAPGSLRRQSLHVPTTLRRRRRRG